jgi:hypothetical protein
VDRHICAVLKRHASDLLIPYATQGGAITAQPTLHRMLKFFPTGVDVHGTARLQRPHLATPGATDRTEGVVRGPKSLTLSLQPKSCGSGKDMHAYAVHAFGPAYVPLPKDSAAGEWHNPSVFAVTAGLPTSQSTCKRRRTKLEWWDRYLAICQGMLGLFKSRTVSLQNFNACPLDITNTIP